jgi:hypothetical protein
MINESGMFPALIGSTYEEAYEEEAGAVEGNDGYAAGAGVRRRFINLPANLGLYY